MQNSEAELNQFGDILDCLEKLYRVPLDHRLTPDDKTAYFQLLRPFPIEVIDEAAERVPTIYPTWFPKPGELFMVCEQVISQKRQTRGDNQAAFHSMAQCKHAYQAEIEPPESLFESFEVCQYCGHAKPKIRTGKRNSPEAKYLLAGLSAKTETKLAVAERAAIYEFDAGLSRKQAEELATIDVLAKRSAEKEAA